MAVLNLGIGITFMLLGGRVAALGLANLLAMSTSLWESMSMSSERK